MPLEFLHVSEMASEVLYKAVVLKLVSVNCNLRTVTSELFLSQTRMSSDYAVKNSHVLVFYTIGLSTASH